MLGGFRLLGVRSRARGNTTLSLFYIPFWIVFKLYFVLLSLVFTIRLRQVLAPNGFAIFKGAKSLLLVLPFRFKTQPVLELQDPNEGFYPSKRNSGIIIPGRYKGGIRAQVAQFEYKWVVDRFYKTAQ